MVLTWSPFTILALCLSGRYLRLEISAFGTPTNRLVKHKLQSQNLGTKFLFRAVFFPIYDFPCGKLVRNLQSGKFCNFSIFEKHNLFFKLCSTRNMLYFSRLLASLKELISDQFKWKGLKRFGQPEQENWAALIHSHEQGHSGQNQFWEFRLRTDWSDQPDWTKGKQLKFSVATIKIVAAVTKAVW